MTNDARPRKDRRRTLRSPGGLAGLIVAVLIAASRLSGQEAETAHAYLYLEPYSARFEFLIRAADLMPMIGEPAAGSLTTGAQRRLPEMVTAKAAGWLTMEADGAPVDKLALSLVTVVKGVPGRTEVLKPGEEPPITDAMIGLVWECDLAAPPQRIEFTWHGFTGPVRSLNGSVVAGTQSESFSLTPQASSHPWVNRGRLSATAPLAEVPPVLPAERVKIPLGSILWIVFGGIILGRHRGHGRRIAGRGFITWVSLLLGAAVLWPVASVEMDAPWSSGRPVTPEHAETILRALLKNVYKAFDRKTESEIYDVLGRSIDGDLLQKVYIETIRGLTLDAKDATRVKLDESPGLENPAVTVTGLKMLPKGGGFQASVKWLVIGTVGHWGHQHQRANRYLARITVEPVQNPTGGAQSGGRAWKITLLEIDEERRVQ